MIGDIIKDKPKFQILKSPNLKRKQKRKFVPLNERIKLETVLGLSVTSNAGLSLDCNSGNVAYFAGCVVVLYNPKKNKQSHLFNSSKKSLSCLAFSKDGKYLATGESGHQPAVRVWDMEEMTQVAEFEGHKFGIRCVAFSPNLKYIVSVGYHHDMVVNVWNWKKGTKVASNKVASKVMDVAFSEDGSMFVTVGNRHVKFWYLNASKSKNLLETLPLLGRNGILGEHQNNLFCGVCCNRVGDSDSVFAITEGGLLCQFNEKRILTKWVSLKTNKANAISMGDRFIFVGCSGGLVRVFSTLTLNFIASLPLPHHLGVDVELPTRGHEEGTVRCYADAVAVRYDQASDKLTCVYDDRSLYVWDVTDVKKVRRSRSFLFHGGAVWGVDVFPGKGNCGLPPNCFATCGNDDTVRFWRFHSAHPTAPDAALKRNIHSNELIKILYIDKELSNLRDVQFNPAGKTDKTDVAYQEKNGIRCIKFRPDGKHLASGDRIGNIRVHDVETMTQVSHVEAHDSEVLCLEFTSPKTGLNLLASGSRDRLVHIFDSQNNYSLIQTLDEHSAAVTSIKFVISDFQLSLISCSVDKSLLFRTANVDSTFQFTLARHVVSRATLYDMEVDGSKKYVAVACQDRNIRIYNMRTGKQKKCYAGSLSSEGTLIHLEFDPSSSFVATSCSDKTLAIFNFFSGECVAHMMGHSEVATGLKFFSDLKHLVSTGAEGCIFVWKMNSDMTEHMNRRQALLKDKVDAQELRRTTFTLNRDATETGNSEGEVKLNGLADDNSFVFRFSPGQLPAWARTKFSKDVTVHQQQQASSSSIFWNVPLAPKGKWAKNLDPNNFPLPPSVPYFGWRSDLIKNGNSPGSEVPIIREDADGDGREEGDEDNNEDDDDDEFGKMPLGPEPARELLKVDDADDEEDAEEEEEEEEDDDGEKESNDEVMKEDTMFLPTFEPPIDNMFTVEENNITRLDDGGGDNENFLSYEEDVEMKSVPSSPSSTDQFPKINLVNDQQNFDLSQETFEMTLKRLEVEMKNKVDAGNRCSLSAKYFNHTLNNTNNNDDSNNNNNNNASEDPTVPLSSKLSAASNKAMIQEEDTKKRQAINQEHIVRYSKDGTVGSLGRRQGKSLGGSELRSTVDPFASKLSEKLDSPRPHMPQLSRKWKSLVNVRDNDTSEGSKKKSLNLDTGGGSARATSVGAGRGVALRSILRSQTPNILVPHTAAKQETQPDNSLQRKSRKSTAASTVTLASKVDQESELRKPILRVRSYRMATESSQAKQQNNSTTSQQPPKRLLPRTSKQFQSTPNLFKDGVLTGIKSEIGTVEEEEGNETTSLQCSNISLSSRISQGSKELGTLDEDVTELQALQPKQEPPIAEMRSESEKASLSRENDAEVPERDLSEVGRRTHSCLSGVGASRSTNQMLHIDRPHSSNIQSKSQLQRRLLPSDPLNKLSTSLIEPRPITMSKQLQPKEVENIDLIQAVTNQKQDDPNNRRFLNQSKWGSLRSSTNANITFARPPSRTFYSRSPDPLQNWVKRAEAIQHQWELRNNEKVETDRLESSFKKLSDGDEVADAFGRSSAHKKHSWSADSSREPASPAADLDSEIPTPDRSRRSTSSITFDYQGGVEERNKFKHVRTTSADGGGQLVESVPREGEPASSLRDARGGRRKDGARPRVVFSPVVCLMNADGPTEEEKATEVCEKLKDAVNLIGQLVEEMRRSKEPGDPILQKLKTSMEGAVQRLQTLLGPQSPSQLDKCAEDLTMKMYELIKKKMDWVPSNF